MARFAEEGEAPAAPAAAAPVIDIDPKFARAIDPKSPPPIRLMSARGIVPGAKPADILLIQFALTFDPAPEVASAAKKAFNETPVNVVRGAINEKTHPGVLDALVRFHAADEDLIEFLVLRKQIGDDTLAFLAETSSSRKIVEIIGQNQDRLLQNVKIFEALRKNPVVSKSLIDVTVVFLQMAGVLPTGAEGKLAGLPERLDAKAVASILDGEVFDEALTRDDGAGEVSVDEKRTLLQKISGMEVAKKVKLAFKANKETRQILLRETNRVVVTAVMNSGRLTDGEVIAMAQNPVTASEILRGIDKNRDWCKQYAVQKALAMNPKTPQAIALKYVKNLRGGDLAGMARSSNVPPAIRSLARQLHEEKMKHR